MTWQYKVFKWCDGLGIDMNLAESIEFCRSRVLMTYGGELSYSSCSVIGFIKDVDDKTTVATFSADKNFIEVMESECYWSYYRRVYDVKYVLEKEEL